MFHHFLEPYLSSPFTRHFAAGGLSYLVGSLIRAPLESIKCRQHLCANKFLPTSTILKALYHERRLYTGTLMIVLRDVVPGGLYFAIFFSCKKALDKSDNAWVPAIRKMLLGASMGIMYWLLAYPFDLLRNVQQSAETKEKSSLKVAFNSVMKEYGWKGLYRGMGVTVARTVFSSGISLYLFDLFLRIYGVDFDNHHHA